MWDKNGGANQQWVVEHGFIRSAGAHGKVLDVIGGTVAAGKHIGLWDAKPGAAANQQFQIVPTVRLFLPGSFIPLLPYA